MKYLKPVGYIFLLAICSYASLWYGFMKGWEYNASGEMLEAEQARHNLVNLREGKVEEAIDMLESQMGGNILTAYYSDSSFGKYIIGPTMGSSTANETFSKRVQEYMNKYPYKCHPDKEICDAIKNAVNDMANSTLNHALKAGDAPARDAP